MKKNMKQEGKHSAREIIFVNPNIKSNRRKRTYCSSCRGGFRIDREFGFPNSRRFE